MKKKIVIFLCLLLCVMSVLSGCFMSKHKVVDKNVLKTEDFFVYPDSAIVIINGKEHSLKKEHIDEIYAEYNRISAQLSCDTLKCTFTRKRVREWKREKVCVEFRYDSRREFIGSIPWIGNTNPNLFSWDGIKYDAMLYVVHGSMIMTVPYLGARYVDIDNLYLGIEYGDDGREIAHTCELLTSIANSYAA